MIKKMTTMFKSSSTMTVTSTKSFTTVCGGYIDLDGIWNNGSFILFTEPHRRIVFTVGFVCPMQQFVQYFCCGTDHYHYCCPLNQSISEINPTDDAVYLSGQYQSSDHFIIDRNSRSSLINHSNLVKRQFEQFQKLFLPIFLLTSSILFLIGIAIWFWLYKHKAFYATEQDDLEERNPIGRRTIPSMNNDPLPTKRPSVTFTLPQQSRPMSYISTEV